MKKGFGFIAVPGRQKDLFFHNSALVPGLNFNDLQEGDNVTIDSIESDTRGDKAEGVALA